MKKGLIFSVQGEDEELFRCDTLSVLCHGSFSTSFDRRRNALFSEVSAIFDGDRSPLIKALWDTGSTITVIDKSVVDRLPFVPLPDDAGNIVSVVGKESEVPIYTITLVIGGITISGVQAWSHPIAHRGSHMIIGMDVISFGKLTVNGLDGVFTFEV